MTLLRRSAAPWLATWVVAACATTTFVSAWRSPNAQPLKLKGAKVAAVVMMKDETPRKAAEDQLAREITKRGAIGVPLYTIVPNATPEGESQVRAALEAAQFKGAVVLRPAGSKQEVLVTAKTGYDPFWNNYYGAGWHTVYGTHYETTTDTIVYVDTRIYSLTQNQLVWEGRSKTTNPERVDELVSEVASAVADQLQAIGLIGD